MQQLLIERFTPTEALLSESFDGTGKNLFLAGRMMTADQKNLNRRVYPKAQISRAVDFINTQAKSGHHIMGECNHPEGLGIDLKNVSHIITEAWMDGSYAMGKCKILDTPSGQIIKALINGGVKLGVSSRGTGNVTNEGIVEDFSFVTLDIVAQPSGPGCYPDVIRESVENQKIVTLAEAVTQDAKAQKYLQEEIMKFLSALTK